MLKALGAKLVLTPAPKGMGGAVKKAEQIVASLGENGKLLQQFNNGDNPKIHRCAVPLTCSLLTRFGRRLPMAWRSPRPRWYFPP